MSTLVDSDVLSFPIKVIYNCNGQSKCLPVAAFSLLSFSQNSGFIHHYYKKRLQLADSLVLQQKVLLYTFHEL